jgi:uncharacterized membrane protein HdeD (DUF308 family)
MSKEIVQIIKKHLLGNWILSLVSGVLLVAAGIVIAVMPLESYLTMTVIFGVFLLIAGIMGIIFVVSVRKLLSGIWLYLLTCILDLIIGFVLITVPGLSMMMTPLLMSFWLIYKSFFVVGYSLDLRRYKINAWAWALAAGILLMLIAVLILIKPVIAIMAVVYMTAFLFVCTGIFRIVFGFRLRRIKKLLVEIE